MTDVGCIVNSIITPVFYAPEGAELSTYAEQVLTVLKAADALDEKRSITMQQLIIACYDAGLQTPVAIDAALEQLGARDIICFLPNENTPLESRVFLQ